MNVGCVVMAAGRSRRFGRNKLLEPLGDRPVLSHVLEAIPRTRLARIVAVTAAPETAVLCAAHGVEAITYTGGLRSGTIRTGIRRMAGLDGCLFLLGDQPLLRRESLTAMLDAFACEPNRLVRLSWAERGGSPVLFPSRLFSQLAALTGRQGGMAAGPNEVPVLVPAACEAELWDGDTPEALARITSYYLRERTRAR